MREAARRRPLDDLVAPLSADEFRHGHWPLRPVVLHGPLERWAAHLETSCFDHLDGLFQLPHEQLRAWQKTPAGDFISQTMSDETSARDCYARGATLAFSSLRHPALGRLLRRLVEDLETPVKRARCNAYASPAGDGSALHFDDHEVFFVQLRGRKQWRFAPNTSIPFPPQPHGRGEPLAPENRWISDTLDERMPDDAETAELRPGSVLFLPRGFWHEPVCLEESVHLTLAFESMSWLEVLLPALRRSLLPDVGWRAPAHGLAASGERQRHALNRFSKLLAELSTSLAEDAAGERLSLASHALPARTIDEPAHICGFRRTDMRAELRSSGDGIWTLVSDEGSEEKEMVMHESYTAMVRWILAATDFTRTDVARACPELSKASVSRILGLLESEGLVRRREEDAT